MEFMTDEELIRRINELRENHDPFTRTLIIKKTGVSLSRLIKMEAENKIELPKKMTRKQAAMIGAKAWRSYSYGSRR